MARAGRSEVRHPRRAARADHRSGPKVAAAPRPTPEESRYLEEVAVFYENLGLPRMAGRIMGWLMICDPPQQSLADLGEVLQASKGSISTMTRLLMQIGSVTRTSLPGDRRDYVSIPPGALTRSMATQIQRVRQVRELADRGLEVLQGAPAERQHRLSEMHDFYSFLEREMPLLLARWERENKRSKPST